MKKISLLLIAAMLLIFAAPAYTLPPFPPTPLSTSQETITGSEQYKAVTPAGLKSGLTNTGYDVGIGSATAGKNLTVYATRTSIFTHDAANYNEDGATWTITGTGPLVHVTGNTTTLTLTTTEAIAAGTTYRVTVTGTGGGGAATYTLGGVTGTTIAATGALAITDYITAGTTASLIITPASACTVSITSITIEKLTDATGDVDIQGNLFARSQIFAGRSYYIYPAFSFIQDPTSGMFLDSGGLTFSLAGTMQGRFETGYFNVFNALSIGALSPDVILRRSAAGHLALRNLANQQTFEWDNTYTNSSNYEGGRLTGVAGSSIDIKAVTAGTGADNLNVNLTAAGSGIVAVRPPTETTGGGYGTGVKSATSGTLSGSSGSIAVNVPVGRRIKSVQFRVNTAITSGDGGTTWTAAYVNTPTTAIGSGYAFALNTKINVVHPAYELTTNTVTITVTPNSGTFSGGIIEAFVYYEDFVALSNAP